MTSLGTLSRLGLILIALLALAAAVSRSALADGPESEPGDLGLTQISGTLPEKETEGSAFIQWGGGTLYQLTARLAVNGCDLNLLWVWDSQQERYTAAYTFDEPSFLNNNFNNLYKDNIPPSVIWVKCIDMINHVYGYGLLTEEEQKYVDGLVEQREDIDFEEWYARPDVSRELLTDCGDNWSGEAREYFLPNIPMLQETCLLRDTGLVGSYSQGLSRYNNVFYYSTESFLVIGHSNIGGVALTGREFHELCHANQSWQVVKNLLGYDFSKRIEEENLYKPRSDYIVYSPYMIELIDLVGFYKNEKGEWFLPGDSAFSTLDIYYISDPIELSAELCAGYLMTKAQVAQNWTDYYEPYLTDEVIDWLEKYVFVLPESMLAR